ncbi:MAG: hypothetical protein ABI649_08230 [Gaiellaceae bacterium]
MTREPCPLCDSAAATTVGPVYAGSTRFLWRRQTFEETLYRCAEGHIYSVRIEGESVRTEPHESVQDWLERTTGIAPPERPREL